jgi:predicted regulator of Ras-like GTPase activity (Roadblock/LC7/MglB family)
MEAAQALADLTEISTQIKAAALFSADGAVDAATLADGTRFVEAARALLAAADGIRAEPLVQLEASTADGSVFVVRDGERIVAAVTGAEPTVGLVFYDLKSCLRASAESEEAAAKPKRAPKRKPKEADDGEA